jgi:predicted negative regulator of RcsB-dependent stress response
VFNLINLSSKDLTGLIILSVVGVAGYIAYRYLGKQQADAAANAVNTLGAAPDYNAGSQQSLLAELALLTGGSVSTAADGSLQITGAPTATPANNSSSTVAKKPAGSV